MKASNQLDASFSLAREKNQNSAPPPRRKQNNKMTSSFMERKNDIKMTHFITFQLSFLDSNFDI